MIIPNGIVAAVLVLFFVAFGAAYVADVDLFVSWKSHLVAGFSVLVITFTMFSLRLIGGGDSKLVTAFAFWMGVKGLGAFLMYMVFSGALRELKCLSFDWLCCCVNEANRDEKCFVRADLARKPPIWRRLRICSTNRRCK